MMSPKERRCLHASLQATSHVAERHLLEVERVGRPFDNPLSGLRRIEWRRSTIGKLKQVLLLPVAVVLVGLLGLAVPFLYLGHLWSVTSEKRELRRRASRRGSRAKIAAPEIKTIAALWAVYGLQGVEYEEHDQIEVLLQWLRILYGKDFAESIDLDERLESIKYRHRQANRPYVEGVPGAAHYRFVPAIEVLVNELSQELPYYQGS